MIKAQGEGPLSPANQARAVGMLRGLGLIGVDALGIGEAELALGVEELSRQARFNAVPLLASNLQDARGSQPFLQRRLLSRAGIRVGFFALYEDPPGAAAAATKQGLRVLDPVTVAREQVAALLKDGAELVVMLAHLGMPRAREVAAAVPGIHLGLVSHTGWRTTEPESVAGGRTYLVEPGHRGQAMADLEVRLEEGWQPGLSLGDDSRRFVLYLQASREIEQLRNSHKTTNDPRLWKARILPHAERIRKVAKEAQAAKASNQPHTLIARLLVLDQKVPEQPTLKALVQTTEKQISALEPPTARRGRPRGLRPPPPSSSRHLPPPHVRRSRLERGRPAPSSATR